MQGGRLVTERRMVSDLYVFDLETFVWSRLPPHPDDDVPGARYFHSTDACESPYHFHHCPVRPSFMYHIGAGLLGYRSLVTKNAYTIRCLQTRRSSGGLLPSDKLSWEQDPPAQLLYDLCLIFTHRHIFLFSTLFFSVLFYNCSG